MIMVCEKKQNGFNIVAGIFWILSAIVHGWFYISGVTGQSSNGRSAAASSAPVTIMVILGIVISLLMLISGITIMAGQVGFLKGSSITFGVIFSIFALLFCTVMVHGVIAAVVLGFVFFAVAFFILVSGTGRLGNRYDIGASWILAAVFYIIGMISLIIAVSMFMDISQIRRLFGSYGKMLTSSLIGSVFLICGPTMLAILFTGIYMKRRQKDNGCYASQMYAQVAYVAPMQMDYRIQQVQLQGRSAQAYGQNVNRSYAGQQVNSGYQRQNQQVVGGYQRPVQADCSFYQMPVRRDYGARPCFSGNVQINSYNNQSSGSRFPMLPMNSGNDNYDDDCTVMMV